MLPAHLEASEPPEARGLRRDEVRLLVSRADTDTIHHPGEEYLAGIEAPSGWYAANDIDVGDEVEFLFDPEDYLG